MKEIPLTQGMTAIVDDEDYEYLKRWKWRYKLAKNGEGGYAVRGASRDRKKITIRMHRVILNTPLGYETDHINHNGLDNRRGNLRVATREQNHYNAGKHRDNTSGFKGVIWDKDRGKWRAYIGFKSKHTHLGRFNDKLEAAKAYNEAAIKYHGEFACLNQIGRGRPKKTEVRP